jgi:hypothetical protein
VPAQRQKSKGHTSRRRERQLRPVDLSVFTAVDRRVLSGWQRRNAVTIDAEDVAFHRALEPLANRPRQPPSTPIRPPPRLPHVRRPPRHRSKDRTARRWGFIASRVPEPEPAEEVRHRIVVDFDIPFLSSGKVFSASCYLGRGWLHELLSVLSGTPLPHPPPRFEVDGHELSSLSTALDYTVFLPYACDSFAKVLDDPQVMPHASFVKWNTDMHCRVFACLMDIRICGGKRRPPHPDRIVGVRRVCDRTHRHGAWGLWGAGKIAGPEYALSPMVCDRASRPHLLERDEQR